MLQKPKSYREVVEDKLSWSTEQLVEIKRQLSVIVKQYIHESELERITNSFKYYRRQIDIFQELLEDFDSQDSLNEYYNKDVVCENIALGLGMELRTNLEKKEFVLTRVQVEALIKETLETENIIQDLKKE